MRMNIDKKSVQIRQIRVICVSIDIVNISTRITQIVRVVTDKKTA